MRPTRLEMKGFSIFRDRTVVDFGDADLFALVGPTGAGKSSIIDAVVFALYGSVTRYRNTSLVAPIINQLSNEARVRLDFTVADDEFTAVRVVRRTATGATTKEARLERGGANVANGARELDEATVELVGLSFDQFTKTVVLPQGEFAQFLTDNAKDRQALLRRLLGVDMFRSMAGVARQRAKVAAASRDVLAEQLSDNIVSPADVKALERRSEGLRELGEELEIEVDAVSRSQSEARIAEAQVARLRHEIDLLDDVVVPPDLESLDERVNLADAALDEAQRQVEEQSDLLGAAKLATEELPDPALLRAAANGFEQLDSANERTDQIDLAAEQAIVDLNEASSEMAVSREAITDVDALIEHARMMAGAAGLRPSLIVGEPCPVCDQTVNAVSTHQPADELDQLLQRRSDLHERLESLTVRHDAAVRQEAETRAAGRQHKELVEMLEAQVGDAVRADVLERLKASEVATAELTRLQQTATKTLAEARLATAERERAVSEIRDHARGYTAERDRLSSLHPPSPDDDSTYLNWVALHRWAGTEIENRRSLLTESETDAAAARDRAEKHRMVMTERCGPFLEEAQAMPDDPLTWHAAESARTTEQLMAARVALERQVIAQERIVDLDTENSVAGTLGQLLSATGFEQWLMEDSMISLAALATTRLLELSGGAYSLVVVDGSDFAIRDHHNADEIRGTRTLSGGETFLASLALALALAENITDLAGKGTASVDALFLDEGFGTLDPETLDVVASAIEELGATGRMIGIVTHIGELADRLPTRYEVRRAGGSSTVTRADA